MNNFTHPNLTSEKKSATLKVFVTLDKLFEFFDNDTHHKPALLDLDFSKAFETVPHELLLENIQPFGIGRSLLKHILSHSILIIYSFLFFSFLFYYNLFHSSLFYFILVRPHQQCSIVKIDDNVYRTKCSQCGPNGLTLRPLLFLLNVNGLPKTNPFVHSYGSVDDDY